MSKCNSVGENTRLCKHNQVQLCIGENTSKCSSACSPWGYTRVVQKNNFFKLEPPQTDFPIIWVNIRLGQKKFLNKKSHLGVAPSILIRYRSLKNVKICYFLHKRTI